MTMISPIGGEDAAQAVLVAAEEHYQRAIDALNTLIKDVDAGQSARAKELKSALSELGKATQTAFDERAKVEKRIRNESGAVHDYALDFEQARAEIGRRLACLSTAAGTGSVSDGVE
ncbi:hypothetical protein ATO10_02005 [Actibacterium atlanticum]|uniref:Uncharacterized protein n=1 Tax=Actibacterium atlanticum TaxID=1461693 RepID=A0A058ZQH6_9RHOB|nr:hypothetical protein [Actibacterium atlanticum]KCV83495.1 hypothetical protein ATO10_02005 [Actibacterium atlanticum]